MHRLGLARRDAEHPGVEALDVFKQAGDSRGVFGEHAVLLCSRQPVAFLPDCRWLIGNSPARTSHALVGGGAAQSTGLAAAPHGCDGVDSVGHVLPKTLQIGRARETARHADHGNWFRHAFWFRHVFRFRHIFRRRGSRLRGRASLALGPA